MSRWNPKFFNFNNIFKKFKNNNNNNIDEPTINNLIEQKVEPVANEVRSVDNKVNAIDARVTTLENTPPPPTLNENDVNNLINNKLNPVKTDVQNNKNRIDSLSNQISGLNRGKIYSYVIKSRFPSTIYPQNTHPNTFVHFNLFNDRYNQQWDPIWGSRILGVFLRGYSDSPQVAVDLNTMTFPTSLVFSPHVIDDFNSSFSFNLFNLSNQTLTNKYFEFTVLVTEGVQDTLEETTNANL